MDRNLPPELALPKKPNMPEQIAVDPTQPTPVAQMPVNPIFLVPPAPRVGQAPVQGQPIAAPAQPAKLPDLALIPPPPSQLPQNMSTTETGTSVTKGIPMDVPEAELKKYLDEATKAAQDQATADFAKNQVQTDYAMKMQQLKEQQAREQQELEFEKTAFVEAEQQNLEKTSSELMSRKIDPSQLWADMGTKNQIIAGISLLLGAVSSKDGTNKALDIFNKAQDRNIALQQDAIDRGFKGLGYKTNLLKQLQDQYKDKEQARAAFYAIQGDAISKEMDAAGTWARTAESAAQLAEKKAAIQQSALNARTQFAQLSSDKITKTSQTKTAPVIKEEKEAFDREYKLAERFDRDPRVKLAREEMSQISGLKALVESAKEGNSAAMNATEGRFAKIAQGAGVLTENDMRRFGLNRGLVDEISATWEKKAWGGMTPVEKSNAENLIKAYEGAMNRSLAQSAISTMPMVDRWRGDRASVFGSDTLNAIEITKQNDKIADAFGKGSKK